MNMKANVGTTFERFLEQEGLGEEVYAEAGKRVAALQLREAVKPKSKTEPKKRPLTSRTLVRF